MIEKVTNLKAYSLLTKRVLNNAYKSKIERISSEEDLRFFQEKAYRTIGVKFPIEFLAESKTFAVRNRFGSICGGFCIVSGMNSRVIESLPEVALERLRRLVPNYEYDVFEITGLFLCRGQRSKLLAAKMWLKLYREMIKINKKYFIYAYTSSKRKLGEIYSLACPMHIYTGYTKQLPGMDGVDHEVIEVGSVNAIHLAWIKDFNKIRTRFTKGRSQSKRKIYLQ